MDQYDPIQVFKTFSKLLRKGLGRWEWEGQAWGRGQRGALALRARGARKPQLCFLGLLPSTPQMPDTPRKRLLPNVSRKGFLINCCVLSFSVFLAGCIKLNLS